MSSGGQGSELLATGQIAMSGGELLVAMGRWPAEASRSELLDFVCTGPLAV